MLRNSVLYRRLWYMKRRRAGRIHACLCIFSILIILYLFASYAENRIIPYMMEVCEYKVRAMVMTTVSGEITQTLSEKLKYEEIVSVSRDSRGNIALIQANFTGLNSFSAEIAANIQQKLSSMDKSDIEIPFGVLLGKRIFAAEGPGLRLKVLPAGNVEVNFKSEFTGAGMNQTRHSIYLQVRTEIGLAVPLMEKRKELVMDIPLIDTVMAGKMPGLQ